MVGSEHPESVYYKSTQVEKFKNYNTLDYLEISAGSYANLPVVEKEFTGIRNYTVDITKSIHSISSIKAISESEFDPF